MQQSGLSGKNEIKTFVQCLVLKKNVQNGHKVIVVTFCNVTFVTEVDNCPKIVTFYIRRRSLDRNFILYSCLLCNATSRNKMDRSIKHEIFVSCSRFDGLTMTTIDLVYFRKVISLKRTLGKIINSRSSQKTQVISLLLIVRTYCYQVCSLGSICLFQLPQSIHQHQYHQLLIFPHRSIHSPDIIVKTLIINITCCTRHKYTTRVEQVLLFYISVCSSCFYYVSDKFVIERDIRGSVRIEYNATVYFEERLRRGTVHIQGRRSEMDKKTERMRRSGRQRMSFNGILLTLQNYKLLTAKIIYVQFYSLIQFQILLKEGVITRAKGSDVVCPFIDVTPNCLLFYIEYVEYAVSHVYSLTKCLLYNNEQTSVSFVCDLSFMNLFVKSVQQGVRILTTTSCLDIDLLTFLLLNRLTSVTRTHTRTHTCTNILIFQLIFKFKIKSLSQNPEPISSFVVKHYEWMVLIILMGGDIETNPGPNFDGTLNTTSLMLLTQNCRGLNSTVKMRQLLKDKNMKLKSNCYVLALQETYLVDDNLLRWHCSTSNYVFTKAESVHSAGCITFLPEIVRIREVREIDDKGHGHIAVVEGIGSKPMFVCNIYAPVRSLGNEQISFYDSLKRLIDELEIKYLFEEPNLIILGDFNIPFEQMSHKNAREQKRAKDLSEYFNSLGLVDCWKHNDDRITQRSGLSRLDRILYRLDGQYSESLMTDWTFTVSDHCLLQLTLSRAVRTVKNNSRRVVSLPTYILKSKEDVERIKQGMEEFQTMLNPEWEAGMKLEFLKTGLRTVVGECVKARNKKEREELDQIQKQLTQKMVPRRALTLRNIESNKREIDTLFARRDHIMESRSESLATKAKTKWYYEGERSNKYFLNMLRKKNQRIEIDTLDINSTVTNDKAEIEKEVSSFYKNLYEKNGNIKVDHSFYSYVDKVPENTATMLTAEITKEELYETLKTCTDSAPGPDGIPYSYYKIFWFIFGDVILEAWKESILKNSLPPSHKNSILRLLPKQGKDLTKLTNWRPITLSNCDHKLIK
jgi:exonuclease III